VSIVELLVATTNFHKLDELGILLSDIDVQVVALRPEQQPPQVAEDGDSFLANARHKALSIARWSGRAALADDSGLEVDALGGAPGVRSARYAGAAQNDRANIAKLLMALSDVPVARRTARFRCALVVAGPDGATIDATGACEGLITEAAFGAGGFGYDPVFYFPPLGRTFAELSSPEKNRVSHRAKACAALAPRLLSFLERYATRRR
jgi:XTP/dITP diphosphohydrolase